MWAVVASIALGGLSFGLVWWGRAVKPDLNREAAELVAHNVVAQVRAAVAYDSGAQGRIIAHGTQAWTQTVTVAGTSQSASVTATPSGSILLVDVTVNGVAVRDFAPLPATAVAPGMILGS